MRFLWKLNFALRILPQMYLKVKLNSINILQNKFLIRGHFDRQKCTFSFSRKYKLFPKTNKFRHVFIYFYFLTFFKPELELLVGLLRSSQAFRHQDQPNWLMSYFYVICIKWRIWCIWCIWLIWRGNIFYIYNIYSK